MQHRESTLAIKCGEEALSKSKTGILPVESAAGLIKHLGWDGDDPTYHNEELKTCSVPSSNSKCLSYKQLAQLVVRHFLSS